MVPQRTLVPAPEPTLILLTDLSLQQSFERGSRKTAPLFFSQSTAGIACDAPELRRRRTVPPRACQLEPGPPLDSRRQIDCSAGLSNASGSPIRLRNELRLTAGNPVRIDKLIVGKSHDPTDASRDRDHNGRVTMRFPFNSGLEPRRVDGTIRALTESDANRLVDCYWGGSANGGVP